MYNPDRSLAILKPKQPLLDWLRQLEQEPPLFTLDDLRRHGTALLIPEYDDEESALRYIYANAVELLEFELEFWCPERKSAWPEHRTVELFKDWFDVEIHLVVMAYDNGPHQADAPEDVTLH